MMTINIFYDEKGLCYRDYDYESEDKMESRDICFLIAMASAHLMLDEPLIKGGVN